MDFINAFIEAYKDVYSKCEAVGIQWLQFDEPALVQDMTEEDRELFVKMYSDILGKKKSCKVLLQTYFGDVRDVYEDIVKLSFDGIGLDFIEGKKTAELIEKYGFPKDKVLFAGLVNGKNIWKNHYEKTLNVLKKLEDKGIQTVLSTSCSLQHVPYTLKHENKLSNEYLNYFAFAEEKLMELKELSRACMSVEILKKMKDSKTNRKLFAGTRKCDNEAVKKRLAEVTEADYSKTSCKK